MSTYAERAAIGLKKPQNSQHTIGSKTNGIVVKEPTQNSAKGVITSESVTASNPGDDATGQDTNGSELKSAESKGSSADPLLFSRWRPDIYVQSFVPHAFKAINESPATLITTPSLDDIDFETYLATFYGSSFRAALPDPSQSAWDRKHSINPSCRPEILHYEAYFQKSLLLDVEGHVQEIGTFDLFGAVLLCQDVNEMLFTFLVPGLRENLPPVSYGDDIMLRQWVEGFVGAPALGFYGWYPQGPDHPGFTGLVIEAVVVGVDKMNETLHVRAAGLIEMPRIRCNVHFVKQARTLSSLQMAVTDMARALHDTVGALSTPADLGPTWKKSLSRTLPNADAMWARYMLFPASGNGILQESLPSLNFPQQWFDTTLNYEQMKAVDAVTTTNYGQFCYLINGPPGTGKTKTLCEIVTQLGKHSDLHGSILLCAPSNQAADTLAQRLSHHFSPSEMLRLNHFSRTFAEVPIDLMIFCFVEGNVFNIPPISALMAFKIVITTCQDADILVQARVSNRDILNLQRNLTSTLFPRLKVDPISTPLHWSALIVDEAAQATEPETLIPLSLVTPPFDAPQGLLQPIFVMAGDQHQLSPRTYDKSTTNLHISLFERLSNDPVYASHPLARRSMLSKTNGNSKSTLRPPFTNLLRNYRSHPAILAIPSSLFYANTLIPEASNTGTVSHWSSWSGPPSQLNKWPVQFRCNGGIDDCESIHSTHSWYNLSEAHKAIACAYNLLCTTHIAQPDICIMSPFRAQVRLLRRLARTHTPTLQDINIGPMEAFQGLESQFVILCTTRARRRFLPDDRARGVGIIAEPQRFNVALTRAREGLVVLGNPHVLDTDPCWRAFLCFCWRNGLWMADDQYHHNHDHREIMQGLPEGKVNEWTPPPPPETESEMVQRQPSGLEAALLFKEREQWAGSKAAKRFLGRKEDEELWMKSGMDAEEVVRRLDALEVEDAEL